MKRESNPSVDCNVGGEEIFVFGAWPVLIVIYLYQKKGYILVKISSYFDIVLHKPVSK